MRKVLGHGAKKIVWLFCFFQKFYRSFYLYPSALAFILRLLPLSFGSCLYPSALAFRICVFPSDYYHCGRQNQQNYGKKVPNPKNPAYASWH